MKSPGKEAGLKNDNVLFDRSRLRLKPLRERVHDIDMDAVKSLERVGYGEHWANVASRIVEAKKLNRPSIMMIGAHVIRSGVQRYIIDLMERGYLSCLSTNGAGIIHDYEFSLIGATTESVARYIQSGEFGLWSETGGINDIVNRAFKTGNIGMGEAIGKAIQEGSFPHKEISLFAACYRLRIPVTVHIGIGYDIIHEHPNFDGAAAGAASYIDFLKFAQVLLGLEEGVVMNFGSAIMAPEVFLKALSMARNVAHPEGGEIRHFTTLVCDLQDLPDDFNREPAKGAPGYYFRPWKTMLARTVADGGRSFYIKGRHEETIPALWSAIGDAEGLR
jgi:hypothetical protein